MPIDPSFAISGAEWAMPATGGASAPAAPGAASGGGFGDALTKAVDSLEATQQQAADASQALATGTASDPEVVVMAIERARLEMELASQIRTKATDAVSEIMRTQI
ncbi:MAG TPA: flagellar hook-basal body complex protein FliE [Solirubrobacteraceae bacterium]|nr:flagellar hook-basal body complex protein FliE [Solirubrobacteraceae bacterium]